ncbi:toxA transcriptional regulator ToxR, partial [Pseudomonas aeruginosa]|nr:toxA transcriptional regulator ToxR [Pseudomonas aeruginosa]
MTATDRTPPPLKWLCLGNRDANDGFELFAHGIYARNGALVGSKLSLRERRQRVDLSAFLSGAPPLLAEAAVKHLLARLLCVHRHNTDLELLGKNFIPLHASSLGNAGVCERILASARQLQQHQVELCLLLAIDEQEPASAEYLASLARLRDSGVRI